MKNRDGLLLSVEDYQRLAELVLTHEAEHMEQLLTELDRATILAAEQMPPTVVKMNSTLVFKDLDSGEESEVTLVYPEQSDIAKKRISVLAPMGSALIGLSEGQDIKWALPSGKVRRIQVIRIMGEQQMNRSEQL